MIHMFKMNNLTRRQEACIIDSLWWNTLSVSRFVVIIVFHWHFELNRVLPGLELDFLIRLCVAGGERERERERERGRGRERELTYCIQLIRCIFSAHLIFHGRQELLLQLLVAVQTILPHQHKHTLQGGKYYKISLTCLIFFSYMCQYWPYDKRKPVW